VTVPLYMAAKRRYTHRFGTFLGIHVLGNLVAFLVISLHFSSQISRPAQFYPELSTGVTLYPFMIILVTTGFLYRFNLLTKYLNPCRFLHKSSVIALFLILIFHILHGIGMM
ncbi:MAG: hypothetical protein P8Y18_05165, partial [Candidatus Bathyarchaeota archaeon]